MISATTYLAESDFSLIYLLLCTHFQPAADAKHYGHFEVYTLLRSRGAKLPVRYIFTAHFTPALIHEKTSFHVCFPLLC
jgi:hypothetical protein